MITFADADFSIETLKHIVSPPTAPLHEHAAAERLLAFVRDLGLTPQIDAFGNIIVRYRKDAEAIARPFVLVAHMDHPAFEIVDPVLVGQAPAQGNFVAQLLGGVAPEVFRQPVPVRIYPKAGQPLNASVRGYATIPAGWEQEQGTYLFLSLSEAGQAAQIVPGDFGVWALPDFEADGEWLRARALDDLAGCTAAILTLCYMVKENLPGDVIAVFTRAEEIGLIGATLVAQQRSVPDNAIVVSVETSKTLPGALQGGGPVIRTGDRSRTFDVIAEDYLQAAANVLTRQNPPVPVQRQLMNAGGCEATTFSAHGYTVTGLAFPLGNWHNVTDEKTIALENIHRTDFLAGVLLLQTAAKLAAGADIDLRHTLRERLDKGADSFRARLEKSAEAIRKQTTS